MSPPPPPPPPPSSSSSSLSSSPTRRIRQTSATPQINSSSRHNKRTSCIAISLALLLFLLVVANFLTFTSSDDDSNNNNNNNFNPPSSSSSRNDQRQSLAENGATTEKPLIPLTSAAVAAAVDLILNDLPALPPYNIDPHAPTLPEYKLPEEWNFLTKQDGGDDDVTIIFNVFKGPAVNLERQLDISLSQKFAKVKEVWVMAFNSPLEEEYGAVIEKIRQRGTPNNKIPPIHYTRSSSNYKFHGRFYLAYMATSKYIAMMDDDIPIDKDMMANFIDEAKRNPLHLQGMQGVFRSSSNDMEKSKFRVGYNHNIDNEEQLDYLCGFWFFKREWLQAFFRENPLTFTTGEDIHLSHTLSKYLGVTTHAKEFKQHAGGARLNEKTYTATKGSMYVIRNEMFRINAGRGNQIADETPLDSFVFVPTSKAAVSFLTLHRHFTMDKARIQSKSKELADVLSKLGKSSMLFTGRQVYKGKSSSSSSSSSSSPPSSSSSSSSSLSNNNDLNLLKRTADDYCDLTHCTYTLSLPWGDKMRPITYHNMHLGLALEDSEFPLHTLVSDFITTLVSLFRNARRVEVLVVVVDQSVGEMGMLVNAIDLALDIVAEEGDRTRPHVYKIEM